MSNFTSDVKYNQLRHKVDMYLDNSNGKSDNRKYLINPAAIVNLTIDSDLSDWITRGTLTILYDPSAGIGMKSDITGQTTDNTVDAAQKHAYVFRNDGDDLLRIKIIPCVDDSSNLNSEGSTKYAGYNVKEDDKFWALSYMFTIYDMEDVDQPPGSTGAASADVKCLKLYFYDIRYQKMNSNLIEYSTALSDKASKSSLLEKDTAIPTGIAIKEIIESSIRDLGINVPKKLTGTDDEWEDGGTSMFFTAPAYSSAYDCLAYVYDCHVSNTKGAFASPKTKAPRGGIEGDSINDVSLLTIVRGPTVDDVGYFALRPLSWYFSQAGNELNKPGKLQTEHFFLQGYGSEKENLNKTFRAPLSDSIQNVDIKSAKHNNITNYRFVDISPLTNSNVFRTRPVYSFDFSSRKFNIEFEKHSVKKAREFIAKQYIKNLYKNSNSNPEDLFLINLDKDKRDLSLTPTFSLHGENPILRQSDGIKKLIYTGLFQNACVHFRVLGLPCRQVGQFIAIDRTEGVEPSPHNDKFYGQWFIISLRHVFEGEIYYNEITAVKTHRFDKSPIELLGTIDKYE